MDLYFIRRRDGWKSADELGVAAERSKEVAKRALARRTPGPA